MLRTLVVMLKQLLLICLHLSSGQCGLASSSLFTGRLSSGTNEASLAHSSILALAAFAAGRFKPGTICDKGTEVGQAALAFGKEVGVHDHVRKMRDDSLCKDCTPNQANFARIFCDVHCVRDAVVRGDRTILRNLERATGITNRNMEKLAEWLANTQDHQTEVMNLANQKQFNELKEMVGGDKKLLFLKVQQQTRKIRSELQGFATGASFSRAASMAANDALEKFAEDGASSLEDANSRNTSLLPSAA
eukprot:s1226_g4.t1